MNMRWYIVHAYSNFEKKVADSIREQASQRGLAEKFEEILVPTEQVVEVRRGRKINSERKFFPGYVLVKCDLTDEVYHLIKNTPKVTGFLGADKKPMPIPDLEADRIKGQVADGVERPKAAIRFEIGENVRVADGPFASFNGVVEEVDDRVRGSRSRCRSSAGRRRISNSARSRRSESYSSAALAIASAGFGPASRRIRRAEQRAALCFWPALWSAPGAGPPPCANQRSVRFLRRSLTEMLREAGAEDVAATLQRSPSPRA